MSVKPPIHRRLPTSKPSEPISDTPDSGIPVQSLAERIAILGLDARTIGRPAPPSRGPPRNGNARAMPKLADEVPDLAKLLARRPPPPPARRKSTLESIDQPLESPQAANSPPPPPPRRLPPAFVPSAHVPPIPPPVNLASKPSIVSSLHEASSFGESSCIQCRDFSAVDAHAALFPRNTVHSLEDLAYGLTEPFDDDVAKARALFIWLHYNIVYDVEAFLTNNLQQSTPESTLSSGRAVCDGYAGLFEHLANIVGLQAQKVSGHGKGYGYKSLSENDPIPEMTSNHAWNCVYLNEEWHLVDACWGAGHLNGTVWETISNPTWFIASPLEFGRRHFPQDPAYQLTEEQTTWEEYIMAPEGPTLTSDFPKFGLDPIRIEPMTINILEKRYAKFSVCKRCEHVSTSEADNYVFVLTTSDRDFTPLTYNEEEGAWTATIFTPRNGTVMLCAVDTIGQQDARGVGVAGYMKVKGKKAMTFKGLATWKILHL